MSIIKAVTRFINTVAYSVAPCLPPHNTGRALPLEKFKLPPGFSIELWAEVPNARGLDTGEKWHRICRLFVGRQGLCHN